MAYVLVPGVSLYESGTLHRAVQVSLRRHRAEGFCTGLGTREVPVDQASDGLALCAGLSLGSGLEDREWLSTNVSEVSSGQTHHGTRDTGPVAGTQHPGVSVSGLKGQSKGRGHGLDPPEGT